MRQSKDSSPPKTRKDGGQKDRRGRERNDTGGGVLKAERGKKVKIQEGKMTGNIKRG